MSPVRLRGWTRGRWRWCGRWRRRRVGRPYPDRQRHLLRLVDVRRVERRLTPRNFERQFRVVDDAPVAGETAEVMRRAHENAVHRARVNAQRAEHALRVINLEPG